MSWRSRYNDGVVRMVRVLCLLAGLMLGIQGTVAGRASDDACAQSCPEDGPDGKCPPGCADCACCGHLVSAVPAIIGLAIALPPPSIAQIELAPLFPPSPDPAEVLHVPKSPRA